MAGTGNTTIPSSSDDFPPAAPAERLVPTLILLWSADEPHRVGEAAHLDDEKRSGWVLGRGAGADDEPRVVFAPQCPGSDAAGVPLAGKSISRSQLRFRPGARTGSLTVENIGRAVLLVDGLRVEAGVARPIAPGATVLLRAHSIFLFVLRPRTLPAPARGLDSETLHAFGEPDRDGIVGESPAAWTLRRELESAVRARGHVLVHGPSGTGKELVARAIHRLSGRRGPLVRFNAATLTPTLSDSILFGNPANYPNHGQPERRGLLGEAQGGTFFLDELGELPIDVQARLLRALEGEYVRVGESRARKLDVLFVSATNRDLSTIKHDVRKRFASVIETPPLSARMEDLPLLARALILRERDDNPALAAPFVRDQVGGRAEVKIASALVLAILRSSYDGNLRDLKNMLLRAMTETAEPPLMPPLDMSEWQPREPRPSADLDTDDAQDAEDGEDADDLLDGLGPSKTRIEQELAKHGWHQGRTAKALGIGRYQLRRRMKKLGIRRP